MKAKFKKIIVILVVLAAIPTAIIVGRQEDFVPSVDVRKKVWLEDETSNDDGISIKEITIDHDGKHCWAKLVLTPWPKRETLSVGKLADIERAFKSIEEAENIGALNEGIEEFAIKANTTVEDLLVRDIFDLSIYSSDGFPDEHKLEYDKLFNIKLKTEQLKDFVCLLHYTNNSWKIVAGAKVTGEKLDTLTFHASDLSPFAIVIKRGDVYNAVDTGTR